MCQFCVCLSVGHVILCFWRFVTHTDKNLTISRKIRKLILRGKVSYKEKAFHRMEWKDF